MRVAFDTTYPQDLREKVLANVKKVGSLSTAGRVTPHKSGSDPFARLDVEMT